MEYEMWVMPLHEFVQLSVFKPHQTLLEQNKLARRIPSMKAVIFLSHSKYRVARADAHTHLVNERSVPTPPAIPFNFLCPQSGRRLTILTLPPTSCAAFSVSLLGC